MTTANPEFFAHELSHDEWFFLWTAFGQKPDATLKDIHEYRKRVLGMSPKEQNMKLQAGFEALRARGAIVQDTDKNGVPLTYPTGQPIWKGVGKIVTQVQVFNPNEVH